MAQKVVVVAGGASGIGAATARAFAENNFHVVVVDLNDMMGEALNQELGQQGLSAEFQRCDVTNAHEVERLFERVAGRHARLDCAVNAVGGGIAGAEGPIDQIALARWRQELDLNLASTFLCLRHELKLMKAAGSGSVVNVSSIAGLGGSGSNPAYTSGKHAVVGLTRQAAIENGQYGIRVNAVCPGAVHTPMLVESFGGNEDFIADLGKTNVLGRVADPREIAQPIYWLCSTRHRSLPVPFWPLMGEPRHLPSMLRAVEWKVDLVAAIGLLGRNREVLMSLPYFPETRALEEKGFWTVDQRLENLAGQGYVIDRRNL